MIFVASPEGSLIVAMTMADVHEMLGGRSVFVDAKNLKIPTFDRVSFGVFKTQDEIYSELKRIGMKVPEPGKFVCHTPLQGVEDVCEGCQGIMATYLILDKKCVSCWREMARKLQAGSN